AVVAVELEGCGGALGGDERVDDDDAALAFHEGHVRQVEAAYLIDALGDLVQPLLGAEPRLPPQARVRGRRALAVEEVIGVVVPADSAVSRLDQGGRQFRDEAAIGVVEVRPIVKGKVCHATVVPAVVFDKGKPIPKKPTPGREGWYVTEPLGSRQIVVAIR